MYMPGQDPPAPPPGSVQPSSIHKDNVMEMVRQIGNSRIMAGTVLNGVLDDEVSSKKSKVGDIFSISLPEGLLKEGQEILPKMTKVVGTVTSVISARMQRPGLPGNIGISLQTLVLPDGRHMQFFGFMDHNPMLNAKRSAAYNPASTVTKYGRSITHGLTSNIMSGVGIRSVRRPSLPDLVLEKGEPIVLRVNRSLDLNTLQAPVQGFVPGLNEPAGGLPPGSGSAPGLVGPNAMMAPSAISPGSVPGFATPGSPAGYVAPGSVPGLVSPGAVPGLVPGVPQRGPVSGQAPGQVPGLINDPIFNQPIGSPARVDLPDPF